MSNNFNNLDKNFQKMKNLTKSGFSSVAEDYIETPLDLNRRFIKNPLSTYFLKIKGESLNHFGIFENDIAIIDKSLTPTKKSLIVTEENGELVFKKFKNYKKESNLIIWGVITSIIHEYE